MSKAILYPTKKVITVAPGKTVVPSPDDVPMPRLAIAELQKVGPVEYRAVLRIRERWVRVTESLPDELGMGIDYRTLQRLIKGGFLKARFPAPRTSVLDIESWFEHLRKCEDPEFWNQRPEKGGPTHFEIYRMTL